MSRLTHNEYQLLVEQAPILIWRANTEKLCDYFNERWLKFTGRTMAQEYGHGWAECVHRVHPLIDVASIEKSRTPTGTHADTIGIRVRYFQPKILL